MIWFTSDLHFGHDKPFIYEARGFSSVQEMNIAIIRNFQECISPEDELFILGGPDCW